MFFYVANFHHLVNSFFENFWVKVSFYQKKLPKIEMHPKKITMFLHILQASS
jgi:hypothetical protein